VHVPAQELWMIPITWPFAVWGLDMVGPFKRSKNKHNYLLVAIDKFTKWVKAEPVSHCDVSTAVKFLKKLIFRYGYPHNIITDNAPNLSKGVMKQFC
jgi:transposase-like protein